MTAIKPDYDVIAWQVRADVPDPKTKWIDVYCDPSVLFAESDASIAGGVLTQKIRMKWGWASNLTLLISEVKVKLELIGDTDSNEANNTMKLSVPIKKL